MIPETVSQPELATLLGISTRHLRTLNGTVFHPTGEGKSLRYPLLASIKAYVQHCDACTLRSIGAKLRPRIGEFSAALVGEEITRCLSTLKPCQYD